MHHIVRSLVVRHHNHHFDHALSLPLSGPGKRARARGEKIEIIRESPLAQDFSLSLSFSLPEKARDECGDPAALVMPISLTPKRLVLTRVPCAGAAQVVCVTNAFTTPNVITLGRQML